MNNTHIVVMWTSEVGVTLDSFSEDPKILHGYGSSNNFCYSNYFQNVKWQHDGNTKIDIYLPVLLLELSM